MKREIRDIWTVALRDDSYKQCKGQLRIKDEWCCLGVLCDLHRKSTNGPDWKFEGEYFNSWQILPGEVREWAGLNSSIGLYNSGKAALAQDNDDGKSFKEIADIIEANF